MNTQQDIAQANETLLQELRDKFRGLASVSIANGDWRAIMESGAIAELKVSRYRGVKALDAGDLGLDAKEIEEVESIISLGHRMLLPQEVLAAFNTCETRARQIVAASGLKTPLGRFVPATTYDQLAVAMDAYKTAFEGLVADLLYNLPQHRERMIREYERLAQQVLNRLLNADPYFCAYALRDQWMSDFVDRCMVHFPTEDTLRSSFSFALSLSFVPLPYQTQSESPEYANASADLVNLRRAVLREQQEVRSALVNDFLGSVQNELYGLINEALADTLAAIRKNDSLTSRSVVQLQNVVKKISDLNFWGDRRLETIRDEIASLLDRPQKKRSAALATTILEELSYQARAANIDLVSLRDDPIIPPALTKAFETVEPVARLNTAMDEYLAPELAQATSSSPSDNDLVWDAASGTYMPLRQSLDNSYKALESMGMKFEPVAKTQAELDQYILEETTPPARRAGRAVRLF